VPDDDLPGEETGGIAAAGQVRQPTIDGLPEGYVYGVTRYADVILSASFPERLDNIVHALNAYQPHLNELIAGGGGRAPFTKRFDDSLAAQTPQGVQTWGKRNITISKTIGFDENPEEVTRVRGHEIDMFGIGSADAPFPGIAVEMEWNNKDPFYDRDLNNFQALHREGAIAVGVIVTRGPRLQLLLTSALGTPGTDSKFGAATTHWDKLIPKVNIGGGGECPLLLIGIEPKRIIGVERAVARKEALDDAERFKRTWRDRGYERWADARPVYEQMQADAPEL
jgi:hypothetical protein